MFAGPEAYHSSGPTCDTANITLSNNTYEVNNCEGSSVVCNTSGCSGSQALTLSALDGGVYVQLLDSTGKLPKNPKIVSYKDDNTLISHTTDLLSLIKIGHVRDALVGEVVPD